MFFKISVLLNGRFVKLKITDIMGKFIVILIIIYVIYYGINILYDGFLKKTNEAENGDGDEFVIDAGDTPQTVTVDDITNETPYSEYNSDGGRKNQLSLDEVNIINGKVDDQGLSVNDFQTEIGKQLLGESKLMFAGVNFQ